MHSTPQNSLFFTYLRLVWRAVHDGGLQRGGHLDRAMVRVDLALPQVRLPLAARAREGALLHEGVPGERRLHLIDYKSQLVYSISYRSGVLSASLPLLAQEDL